MKLLFKILALIGWALFGWYFSANFVSGNPRPNKELMFVIASFMAIRFSYLYYIELKKENNVQG